MGLNWNFQRGGGIQTKKPSVEGYGYFLEQHNWVARGPDTRINLTPLELVYSLLHVI